MELTRRGLFALLGGVIPIRPGPPRRCWSDATVELKYRWNQDLHRWEYDGKNTRVCDGRVIEWVHYDECDRVRYRGGFKVERAMWPSPSGRQSKGKA